ncbi:MAG: hypothetical protein MJ095_00205 [Oscillospiraceae bacterium]|nr:hypothetical protein [Oscillospiraceae bacterium]
MRTHSAAVMSYLDSDSRQIKVKLSYPGGDEITSVQSLDYDCDFGNSLAIGNSVSALIKVTCEKPAFDISEREFTLYFGVNPGSGDVWTKIGVFRTIYSSVETRMGFTTFTAYDRMYINTNKEFKAPDAPYTLNGILAAIRTQSGLDVPAITSDVQIPQDVFDGYSIRDVIGYVAGYQGKNAYVDCDGKLIFKWFTSCNYTADGRKANVPYADDRDTTINILVCSTGDANIQSGTGKADTELLSFNNPVMTEERLEEIKEAIKGFTYRRADVDIPIGNYLIESGDIIKAEYKNEAFNFEYTVPAMSVSYHYDGGLSCKISSYDVPDGVMKSISARKFKDHTKFNGLQKEIIHATETITGATGGYVRINFGDDGKTAEIMILDKPNAEDAENVWRWNQNGLGHSSHGYNGPFDDVAITYDGHIVADRIAGNQISGVRIETISDKSYLHMDRAHLTYYTMPDGQEHPDTSKDKKLAGLYAFNLEDDGVHRDGLMISCLREDWIALGVDEDGFSNPKFIFRPYKEAHAGDSRNMIDIYGNVWIEGDINVTGYNSDGTRGGTWQLAGGINNCNKEIKILQDRVETLEKLVGGMFQIIQDPQT